jgi:hypothetical protein
MLVNGVAAHALVWQPHWGSGELAGDGHIKLMPTVLLGDAI